MTLSWFLLMLLFCIILHAIAMAAEIGMELFSWQWWVKCIVIGLIAGPLATWIVG